MTSPHASNAFTAGLPLDHIGIAVPDLDAGAAPYLALGLEPAGPDETVASQGVTVRAFHAGASLVELLAPAAPDSAIRAFLERRGAGLHHVAFRVPDVKAAVTRLKGLGASFVNDEPRPGRAGSLVVFLHPRWGGGTLIELVQHAPEGAA